jgi:hypothetical protein
MTFSRDGIAVPTNKGMNVVRSVPTRIVSVAKMMNITGLLSTFIRGSFGLRQWAKTHRGE